MKVGFLCLDWSGLTGPDGKYTPGGAGFYRLVLPARKLREAGYDTVVGCDLGTLPSGEFVLRDLHGEMHGGFDILVLHRWMDEHAPSLIRRARAHGQVVINDVDDWYEGIDTTNAAFMQTHPKVDPRMNRNHYKRALAASSLITTSTPYLASRLRKYGVPVRVLRNAIDLDSYQRTDKDDPIVGWVGAVSHRSRDLEQLRGTLGPMLRDLHLPFFHGGALPGGDAEAFMRDALRLEAETNVSLAPACSILDYPKLFRHFSVGVLPLSPVPFNHAKSCIKGIQMAAAGIPFVASPTPEYEWLESKGIGRVARSPKQWRKMLTSFTNEAVRRNEADSIRAGVHEFDITYRYTDWRDLYLGLV